METKSEDGHYNDGLVDVRVVQTFCLVVFVNADGDSTTVRYDDNLFSPKDLLAAYEKVFKDEWGEDKEARLEAFGEYLVATGCPREDLEDE